MKFLITSLFLALQLLWYTSAMEFNLSMYYQMPKLFAYDDYDECMGMYNNDAVYCVANVEIEANASSELYNFIMQYSNNRKQHYRHDKLKRGLCVNECRKLIEKLNNETLELYSDSEVINNCINIELADKYELKGLTKIDFCLTSNDETYLDNYDIAVAAFIVILIIVVIISSLYDRYLRNKLNADLNAKIHYQNELKTSKTHQWLTLFSIRRNWCTLSSPSKSEFRDLKIFQWARTFTFLCVILGHSGIFSIAFPSFNPIYIENYYKKLTTMLLSNSNIVVQTFFFMSGFLTAFLFMLKREKERCSNWLFFIKAVIFRYIRLVPLMIFMIALHATWLNKFGDGPFWNQFMNNERKFCRDNWWTNLMFLNNYVKVDEICMLQTWYVAADFWLSVAAYLCLVIIMRFPSLKNWIFSTIIGLSIFITAYVTYVNEFEPIPIVSPELLRNNYIPADAIDKDYFGSFYAPTHMNIGNYFIGVVAGLWYRDVKNSNVNLRNNMLLKIIWYACVIFGFIILLSAYIFYTFDIEKPSICISIIAALIKHSWGVVLAFGTIGVIYHHGWFTRNLLSYDGFKIFGRISYAAFICHLFVLKILMMDSHQMIELSMKSMFTISLACFALSNFFGLFLTICIEIPVSSALKIFSSKRSESIEKLQKNICH